MIVISKLLEKVSVIEIRRDPDKAMLAVRKHTIEAPDKSSPVHAGVAVGGWGEAECGGEENRFLDRRAPSPSPTATGRRRSNLQITRATCCTERRTEGSNSNQEDKQRNSSDQSEGHVQEPDRRLKKRLAFAKGFHSTLAYTVRSAKLVTRDRDICN